MEGHVLAGNSGTRLNPLIKGVSKLLFEYRREAKRAIKFAVVGLFSDQSGLCRKVVHQAQCPKVNWKLLQFTKSF